MHIPHLFHKFNKVIFYPKRHTFSVTFVQLYLIAIRAIICIENIENIISFYGFISG